MSRKKNNTFHKQLVLNRWIFKFFNNGSLDLFKHMANKSYEGVSDDGQTLYYHELSNSMFNDKRISKAEQLRYDINIVHHWEEITTGRNRIEQVEMHLKYFQYLSLLFTEIYLDWYFNRNEELIIELNNEMETYNREQKRKEDCFAYYNKEDLNKLAFWSATGTGKTLMLHVNIRQYLHYYQKRKNMNYPDKIILLTPNEGLTKQHIEELMLSGFLCKEFDKNSNTLPGTIEVLDINKLGEKNGEKVVAVESFEGENLVLVDEGHRGNNSVDGAWIKRREALSVNGFSFEYSATFGQVAAKGMTIFEANIEAKKKKAKKLFSTRSLKNLTEDQISHLRLTSDEVKSASLSATREIYAKCILFDYSYKFFYDDGYGKESLILNLTKDEDAETRKIYFTACLLSFYQQQYLWRRNFNQLKDFNIDRPLWIFVGNKVNDDDSDVLTVIDYLAAFLNDHQQSIFWIKELIENNARLLDSNGKNIFDRKFIPLMGEKPEELYNDILNTLFNSNTRQRLKLVNLKGTKGELALRLGDSKPFGVINIGEDSKFFNLCEGKKQFDTETDDFEKSLFQTINDKDSHIHLLIGSRKFTEGWNSWRVSTMGLLNMGKGEGSQIIQLFGRGVRLKGKDYSLKRTNAGERPKGLFIEKLETLNVFGIKANYMAQFKDYLKEEGVTPSDELIELNLSLQLNLPNKELKTLNLKDGYKENQIKGFKRAVYPEIFQVPSEFEGKIKNPHVVLDLYPKLEALQTISQSSVLSNSVKISNKIPGELIRIMDFDRIYMSLQEYKLRRKWNNLKIDYNKLKDFCLTETEWYTLYIPSSELVIRKFNDVLKIERILIQLIEEYTERYYKVLKNAYEGQFYEVVNINSDSSSLIESYNIQIVDDDDGLKYYDRLKELAELVSTKKITEIGNWTANNISTISFNQHLYYPLIYIEEKSNVPVKIKPMPLEAKSEFNFIKDLERFYYSIEGREYFKNKSLYLLRNADNKSKGLGFALAGNFYPDFLLWLVDDNTGKQWLSFVDPKGIRNLDLNNPKFGLYREIKKIQDQLNNANLVLNAFILSKTSYNDLINVGELFSIKKLEDRNVIFMSEKDYIEKLLNKIYNSC